MSGSGNKTKLAAQLVRRGASVLAEPCPQCGAIQVRYLGKVHCTGHEDLSPLLKMEGLSVDTVLAELKQVMLVKMRDNIKMLESEKDPEKLEVLVRLLTMDFDLLQRLLPKSQSP